MTGEQTGPFLMGYVMQSLYDRWGLISGTPTDPEKEETTSLCLFSVLTWGPQ